MFHSRTCHRTIDGAKLAEIVSKHRERKDYGGHSSMTGECSTADEVRISSSSFLFCPGSFSLIFSINPFSSVSAFPPLLSSPSFIFFFFLLSPSSASSSLDCKRKKDQCFNC